MKQKWKHLKDRAGETLTAPDELQGLRLHVDLERVKGIPRRAQLGRRDVPQEAIIQAEANIQQRPSVSRRAPLADDLSLARLVCALGLCRVWRRVEAEAAFVLRRVHGRIAGSGFRAVGVALLPEIVPHGVCADDFGDILAVLLLGRYDGDELQRLGDGGTFWRCFWSWQ